MKRIALLLLLYPATLTSPSLSQDVETDILQVRLDRIYFAGGTELGLYVGSPFRIVCDGDSVTAGLIDFVGPGISYSRPIADLDSLNITSDCIARLTISDIDSAAIIILGADMPLDKFRLEHETLFLRQGDSIYPNLVDSAWPVGNLLELYLPPNIRFSDGSRLDAETLAWCLEDLKKYSRSYPVRYFFSKLLPIDSGGIELMDGFSLRLTFYHPLLRALYFLSHPDFAVYNKRLRGTGALIDVDGIRIKANQKSFIPNIYYRGDPPALSKLVIKYFSQSFRMKFSFEQGMLDGYIGFGFDDVLAGKHQAESLYPDIAVMMAGIGGDIFSGGRFSTSLYYRFDPARSHLFFPFGETVPTNRWLVIQVPDSAGVLRNERYYPYDFSKGKMLHRSIRTGIDQIKVVYDYPLLTETARYLADISAREGLSADMERYAPGNEYDIRIAFLPASDDIVPFALFAAVLELNDQNAMIPSERQLDQPGWDDCDRGSRLRERANRNKFFRRAEETVVETCGCFTLFRPHVFAIAGPNVRNIGFDFYGYPVLNKIVKFKSLKLQTDTENSP